MAKKTTMMTTKATTATRSEHGKPTIIFSKLVDKLQQHYGSPAPPPSTDPLELVIWENIAYLASDKRRAKAFSTLKQTIGTRPEQILAAKHSALAAIGKAGILPDVSPVMALDSNGLRVLCRVGFAEEQKNYSATYKSVQEALRQQLPRDYDSLIRAHQLLRQHGQELCKRSKPRCTECPVRDSCNYGQKV